MAEKQIKYGFSTDDLSKMDWYELVRRNDPKMMQDMQQSYSGCRENEESRIEVIVENIIDNIECECISRERYLCNLINRGEKNGNGDILDVYEDLILFPEIKGPDGVQECLEILAKYMPTENIILSEKEFSRYTIEEIREEFFQRVINGNIRSDSGMEDFRDEWERRMPKTVVINPWKWLAEKNAEGTKCQLEDGTFCKHIQGVPDFGECIVCNRNPRLRDMFETE